MSKSIVALLLSVATSFHGKVTDKVEVTKTPQQIFEQICAEKSVSAVEKGYWESIIKKESDWNHLAENKESGAYGLGQALPKEKMAKYGDINDPRVQLLWMYDYMIERYGDIEQAYIHHILKGWY